MTHDEALRELGLDAEATPDQIRRAYARGVKTRKPEVDPDGFRRLREAYEVAAGRGETAAPAAETASARETGETGEAGEPGEPILDALVFLLHLQAAGKVAESREALDSLRTEIEARGGEISVFGDNQRQLLWSLTQEMVALPDSFPLAARHAFARALLAGDSAVAKADLRTLAERDPSLADKAVSQLRRSTGLGNIFRSMLLPERPTPPLPVWSETSHDSARMILNVLRVSLVLAITVGSLLSVSHNRVVNRVVEQAPERAPTGPGWDTRLQEEIQIACRSSHDRKESAAFCRWGPESLRDLAAGNCSEAMKKLTQGLCFDPGCRSAEKSLGAAITQRCYK